VFEVDGVCGTSVPLALGESGVPLAAQLARFGAIAAVFGTAIALALTFAMRQWDRVWARAIRHDELVIGANPSSLPIIKTLLEWRRDLSDDADRRVNIAVLSLPGEEQTAQTVRDWGGRVHPIMIGTDRDPTSGNGAGNEDAYALNTMEDSDSDATRAQLKTQTARSLRPFLTTRGRPAVTRVWILHDDLELALNLQDSARAVLHSTRGPVWPGLRKSLYSWITRQKPDEQDAHDRLRARFVPRPVLRWLKDGASPRLEVRVVTLCDDRREAQNLRSQLMTQESRPRKVLEVKGATVTARKQTWVEVIVDPVCPDEVSATEVVGRVFARMKAVGARDYHLVLCGDTALADAMLQALALRCWEQQRLDQAWEQFRLDTIVDPQVNEALPKIKDLSEESATPSPHRIGRFLRRIGRFLRRLLRRGPSESEEFAEQEKMRKKQEKEQHKQAQKAREDERDKLKKEISQRADPFPDDDVERHKLQERLTELEKSFKNGCDPDDLLVGGALPASVIVVSPTADDLIGQWRLSAAPDVRNALSPKAVAVDWTDLKGDSLPQAPLAVVLTESVDLSRSHLTERLNARLRPNCTGMWVLSRRITKSCPQSYADHEYAFAGNVLLNGRLPEDYWTRMARMQHEVFRRSNFDSNNFKRLPWWHREEAMRLKLAPGMRWGRAGNLHQVRIFRQWLVQRGYRWGPIQPGADRWIPTDELVECLSKLEQYRWVVENSSDASASLDPREIPPDVLDQEWEKAEGKDQDKTRGTIRANFELMQALGYIPVRDETADTGTRQTDGAST
jgi:hypothetical protein